MTLAVASLATGCSVTDVDLGSDRASAPGRDAGGAGGASTTTSDCPALTEAELDMLRGSPCDGGTCGGGLGTLRAFTSSAEIEAVTAGRWQTCDGPAPWTTEIAWEGGPGPMGIEFQAGCTLFLLYETAFGVARGTSPEDQGTFNVLQTTSASGVSRSIEMFFPTFTWTVGVRESDCPHELELDAADGGATSFVALPASAPPTQ